MALKTTDLLLIEQRVTNDAKSVGVAYLFWFLFWFLGAHRFYIGKISSGFAMLGLSVLALLLSASMIGPMPLFILIPWALVDAFLIPGMVQTQRAELRAKLIAEITPTTVRLHADLDQPLPKAPDLIVDELWDWGAEWFVALMLNGSVIAPEGEQYRRFESMVDWRNALRVSPTHIFVNASEERRNWFFANVGKGLGLFDKSEVKPLW